MMLRQLARFLLVGVMNTLVGLGTIYALKWFGGIADVPANFGGYAVGLCVSFFLNRQWTFADRGRISDTAVRFFLVFAVAYVANLATMLLLRDRLHVDPYVAHLLSAAPYTALFFLGSRMFVFRTWNRSRRPA